jgi:(S)-sulfolactate dehydrogenase
MAEIVISEFMDADSVASLAADFDVLYDPELVDQPQRLHSLMPGVRALVVRNRTQVRDELLDASPNLEVIGRLGVGLDNIDVESCEKRGITVCPASGANDTAVAEYVICAAMLLLRSVFLDTSQVVAGRWPRSDGIGRELSDTVLGLVGYGGIAREVSRRARALGMSVHAFDPHLADDADLGGVHREESLLGLLQASDVVSVHVPLTNSTRNLIDAAALAHMREGSILINTARGNVVDEDALIAALRAGAVAGAALDVFSDEPLTGENAARFAEVPGLILTPHIAGVTLQSNVRVSRVTAENVRRVLAQGSA